MKSKISYYYDVKNIVDAMKPLTVKGFVKLLSLFPTRKTQFLTGLLEMKIDMWVTRNVYVKPK